MGHSCIVALNLAYLRKGCSRSMRMAFWFMENMLFRVYRNDDEFLFMKDKVLTLELLEVRVPSRVDLLS